jgi:predicted secreted protein
MRIDGPQITSSLTLNGTTITDLNMFATTASLNTLSGSYATTGSNLFKGTQTISGSLIPAVDNTYDLGSITNQFRDLYLSSASLYIDGTKVLSSTTQELQITTDAGQSFKILEAGSDTITLQSNDGNITLATSGGGDVIMDPTNGIIALKGTTTVYAGNKIVASDGNNIHFGDGIVISGSILSTGTALVSGSSQVLNGSGVWSGSAQLPSGILSSSTQLSGFGFATTGSNNFVGTQTITGSLFISQNLVVQGSSSLENITASAVNIGANIVNLNTATPAIRFAGLNIFDSGSIGSSGSFLYDSVQDEFIFVHRGDNINVTSSVVMMGPQTYNNIGSEIYPTNNRILKGLGNEHVGDSIMSETGGSIGISGSLSITGSIISTGTSLVSGSSQIDVMSTTNIARLATTGSNTFNGDIIVQGNDNSNIRLWRYYSGDPSHAGFTIQNRNGDYTFTHNSNGGGTNINGNLGITGTATIAYNGLSGDFGTGYTTGLGVGYSSSVAKGINMGWNTALDMGFIGSVHNGTGWKSLILSPIGGDVYIGATGGNNLYAGSARFSGIVGINGTTEAGWGLKVNQNLKVENNNGTTVLQLADTSTGGKSWSLISAGASNAHSIAAGTFYLRNSTDSSTPLTITSTGAATFSSSVDVGGNLNLTSTYPRINLTDTNHNSDYSIINADGIFTIYDNTVGTDRFTISALGASTFLNTLTSSGLLTGQASIYQTDAGGLISSNRWGVYNGGATTMRFLYNASGDVIFDNGSPRLTLSSGGSALFNVNASSSITLTSAGTDASMVKAGSGDELYLGGNDTWQMRLSGGNILMDNGGNVGINTGSPSARLDINGSVRYRGSIYDQFNFVASGNYTNGTYYNIVGVNQISSGIYVLEGLVDTYSAGGGIYFVRFVSVPFYMWDVGSNSTTFVDLPPVLGTGHHLGNPFPLFRLQMTLGGGGIYLQFNPNSTWAGMDNVSGGKIFQVNLKRLGA